MENLEEADLENKEKPGRLIGRITVIRHGDTKYTGVYPDLTEEGVDQIWEQSQVLSSDLNLEKEEIIFVSSPAPRTTGSMDIIKEELNSSDQPTAVVRAIRGVDVRDREKAMAIINEVMAGGFDIAKIDKAYATEPRFAERPDIWEAPVSVERRALRAIEFAIRGLKRAKELTPDKEPHIIATSHFEIVDLLLSRVFGREPGDFPPGSRVDLELLENDADPKKIKMTISFRGETREAIFDREKREIKI